MTILETTAHSLKRDAKQHGTPHYYLIAGSELQIQKEAVDAVEALVYDPNGPYGCSRDDTQFYTEADKYNLDELLQQESVVPLFATIKFIKFVYNKKLTPKAIKELTQLVQSNSSWFVYCFVFTEWDRKSEQNSLFKALNHNVDTFYIKCDPIKAEKYPAWIRKRLREMKFTYDEQVVDFLHELFENNMFGLQQCLEQIKLRGIAHLTIDTVAETSEQSSDYTIGDLLFALYAKQIAKTISILDYLVFTKKVATGAIIEALRRELKDLYSFRGITMTNSAVQFLTQPLAPSSGFSREQIELMRSRIYNRKKLELTKNLIHEHISRKHIYELFIFLADIDIASKTRDNDQVTVENLKQFFLRFHNLNALMDYELFNDLIRL